MNTCGTCKYFGDQYQPLVYDDDGNDVETPIYHTCALLEHLNAGDPPKVWPMAGVTDGSGYAATFRVQEDFGCNQWSAADGTGDA